MFDKIKIFYGAITVRFCGVEPGGMLCEADKVRVSHRQSVEAEENYEYQGQMHQSCPSSLGADFI